MPRGVNILVNALVSAGPHFVWHLEEHLAMLGNEPGHSGTGFGTHRNGGDNDVVLRRKITGDPHTGFGQLPAMLRLIAEDAAKDGTEIVIIQENGGYASLIKDLPHFSCYG